MSAAIGAIVTLIIMLIIMVLLCAWVSAKAYAMGHRDAREGKWVGNEDDEETHHPIIGKEASNI